ARTHDPPLQEVDPCGAPLISPDFWSFAPGDQGSSPGGPTLCTGRLWSCTCGSMRRTGRLWSCTCGSMRRTGRLCMCSCRSVRVLEGWEAAARSAADISRAKALSYSWRGQYRRFEQALEARYEHFKLPCLA